MSKGLRAVSDERQLPSSDAERDLGRRCERPPQVKLGPVDRGDGPPRATLTTAKPEEVAGLLGSCGEAGAAREVEVLAIGIGCSFLEETIETEVGNVNGALARMHALAPHDAQEAMLFRQAIVLDSLMTRAARAAHLALNASRPDAFVSFARQAAQLARACGEQFEAARRWRQDGTQRVVVQHVNVEDGGQAVVAGVAPSRGGGGGHA